MLGGGGGVVQRSTFGTHRISFEGTPKYSRMVPTVAQQVSGAGLTMLVYHVYDHCHADCHAIETCFYILAFLVL